MDSYRYPTLSEAAEVAVTLCHSWQFTASGELYDKDSLLDIAQIFHDEEIWLDGNSFYLVSPGGAIGFSEDRERENIEWLFLPLQIYKSNKVIKI